MALTYTTHPRSGTIHIAASQRRTLCGMRVDHRWTEGDETLVGIAATCETCRGMLHLMAVG